MTTELSEEEGGDVDLLFEIAVGHICQHEDPEVFLTWFKRTAPTLAPRLFGKIAPEDRPNMAYWLGVSLWDSTPLPGNDYRPSPLPSPERNKPCPCGSGRKYKHCCGQVPRPKPMPLEVIWPIVIRSASPRHWLSEAKAGRLPVLGVVMLAGLLQEEGRPKDLIKLLDPVFAGRAERLDYRFADLIDILCDAYDEGYSTDRKKADLLGRMSSHKDRSIRAAANQRRAAWLQELGDSEGAWAALQEAMRADPTDPSNALLELTLRCVRGEVDMARERARFWLRKLQPRAAEFPGLIEMLEHACEDPCGLYRSFGEDQIDVDLRTLCEFLSSVAVPTPGPVTWRALPVGAQEEGPDEDLFGIDPMKGAHALDFPGPLRQLEKQWSKRAPVEKPFSIEWAPPGHPLLWHDMESWLGWLRKHPEALSSPDVLDDLFNLVLGHPDTHLPWVIDHARLPLLRFARAAVDPILAARPWGATLPWLMSEHRPLLRLVVRLIELGEILGEGQDRFREMARYRSLNPSDNHGYRTQLVEALLRRGEDRAALELIAEYPDDMFAEICFGAVLGHYRAGECGEALTSLIEAHRRLPLVLDYLLKDEVRRPKLSEHGITLGGRDQAWLYRDSMRDVWLATPGLMDWLRQAKPMLKKG